MAFAVLLSASLSGAKALAQTPTIQAPPSAQTNEAARAPGAGELSAAELSKLTEEERQLIAGSRAAIISTGLSAAYFDRHFVVARVVNTTGDRRVVWRLRAGEHETFIIDSIGFYTDEKGRRVNTHSVVNTLGNTRDIRRTITRRRAEQLMRACIGPFDGGAVLFQPVGTPRRASLFFSATSAPPAPTGTSSSGAASASASSNKPGASPDAGQSPAPATNAQEGDRLRPGGKKPPPPLIGFVDLQTGRCTAGYGLAGAYPPLPPPRRPQKRRN